MIIVSDTSPITNLIQIDRLNLLQKIFKEVVISEKVFEELSRYEGHRMVIENCDWFHVVKVLNRERVIELDEILDAGEAEAIILAQELNADFLIIDERRGRKVAEDYGLKIIGLLGILIRAKQDGHIQLLKPVLDKLINEVKFRVSRGLYLKILNQVGE